MNQKELTNTFMMISNRKLQIYSKIFQALKVTLNVNFSFTLFYLRIKIKSQNGY